MKPDSPEFSVAQARVQASYDEVPYISRPFAQSHPNRIGAVAALFGLKTPDVATAHVLEIGCAGGGNLIPMAASYPKARFLGIDLSSKHISQAQARAAQLGLTNIEFRHQDITTFAKPARGYDYIICHGVYSWVPDVVREAILQVCATCLSPDGVSYVSYNTLPGWRPRQVVRDAMLVHVGHLTDPVQRLTQARAFINFLKEKGPNTPYGAAIREVAGWLGQVGDDYVFHEFLELNNAPCTFYDFVRAANRHGLIFLGECDIHNMLPENHGAEVAQTLRMLGGTDIVASEQYIDVFSGRTFRQTLLIPAARLPEVSRNITPEKIAELHLLGDLQPTQSDSVSFPHAYRDSAGRMFKTRLDIVKKAFDLIVERQPASSNHAQLVKLLKAAGCKLTPADNAELLDALTKAVLSGLLVTSKAPVEVGRLGDAHPIALELVRGDAANGQISTANLRHEPVDIGIVARHVMPLLDGAHDNAAVHDVLMEAARAGTIHFTRPEGPVTDEAGIEECVTAHLKDVMRDLERRALLVPKGHGPAGSGLKKSKAR